MDKKAKELISTYKTLIKEYNLNIKDARRAKRKAKSYLDKLSYKRVIRHNRQQKQECIKTIQAIKITNKRSLWVWLVVGIISLAIAMLVPAASVMLILCPFIIVMFFGILGLLYITKR